MLSCQRAQKVFVAKSVVVGACWLFFACAPSPAESSPEFVETRLQVSVVDSSGAPVVGATVQVSNPLSLTGAVWTRTTNPLGAAEIFQRVPDAREWLPVSISVRPPEGSGLAPTLRPDSMRFQRMPVAMHAVTIQLDSL